MNLWSLVECENLAGIDVSQLSFYWIAPVPPAGQAGQGPLTFALFAHVEVLLEQLAQLAPQVWVGDGDEGLGPLAATLVTQMRDSVLRDDVVGVGPRDRDGRSPRQ